MSIVYDKKLLDILYRINGLNLFKNAQSVNTDEIANEIAKPKPATPKTAAHYDLVSKLINNIRLELTSDKSVTSQSDTGFFPRDLSSLDVFLDKLLSDEIKINNNKIVIFGTAGAERVPGFIDFKLKDNRTVQVNKEYLKEYLEHLLKEYGSSDQIKNYLLNLISEANKLLQSNISTQIQPTQQSETYDCVPQPVQINDWAAGMYYDQNHTQHAGYTIVRNIFTSTDAFENFVKKSQIKFAARISPEYNFAQDQMQYSIPEFKAFINYLLNRAKDKVKNIPSKNNLDYKNACDNIASLYSGISSGKDGHPSVGVSIPGELTKDKDGKDVDKTNEITADDLKNLRALSSANMPLNSDYIDIAKIENFLNKFNQLSFAGNIEEASSLKSSIDKLKSTFKLTTQNLDDNTSNVIRTVNQKTGDFKLTGQYLDQLYNLITNTAGVIRALFSRVDFDKFLDHEMQDLRNNLNKQVLGHADSVYTDNIRSIQRWQNELNEKLKQTFAK